CGAVAHRARDNVIDNEAVRAAAIVVTAGIARLRGLHPEQATLRRRDADRAQSVRRVRKRNDTRGDRRRGAAGRTAGAVLDVPGVMAVAEMAAFRGSGNAELRRVGL